MCDLCGHHHPPSHDCPPPLIKELCCTLATGSPEAQAGEPTEQPLDTVIGPGVSKGPSLASQSESFGIYSKHRERDRFSSSQLLCLKTLQARTC